MSPAAHLPKQLLEEMKAAVWMRTHLSMKMMFQMNLLHIQCRHFDNCDFLDEDEPDEEGTSEVHVAAGANGLYSGEV